MNIVDGRGKKTNSSTLTCIGKSMEDQKKHSSLKKNKDDVKSVIHYTYHVCCVWQYLARLLNESLITCCHTSRSSHCIYISFPHSFYSIISQLILKVAKNQMKRPEKYTINRIDNWIRHTGIALCPMRIYKEKRRWYGWREKNNTK